MRGPATPLPSRTFFVTAPMDSATILLPMTSLEFWRAWRKGTPLLMSVIYPFEKGKPPVRDVE